MKRATILAASILVTAGIVYAWQNVGAVGPGLPLRLVGEYPLTGNATRFDYASMDAARGLVWVAHMGDGSVVAFDARTNTRVGAVELGGEAGNTVYDPVSRHFFVGVQTRDELAEIDPTRLQVLRRYPLPGCNSSHSVVVDARLRAAYVGCQHNVRLIRIDLTTGHVEGSGGTGIGVDVLALDPGLHRLYVASESGVVSVYDVAGRRLRRVAQAFVHLNAHVVAVDPTTHRVYFPLQNVGGRPVMRVMEPR